MTDRPRPVVCTFRNLRFQIYQILIEPPQADPPLGTPGRAGPFDFRVSSGDEFSIQQADREVAANRFELQIKGIGVNWRAALKMGGDRQKLEPTADHACQ